MAESLCSWAGGGPDQQWLWLLQGLEGEAGLDLQQPQLLWSLESKAGLDQGLEGG